MSKNLGVIDDPVREKLFKQLEELSFSEIELSI